MSDLPPVRTLVHMAYTRVSRFAVCALGLQLQLPSMWVARLAHAERLVRTESACG
jgi:hypothetical protein